MLNDKMLSELKEVYIQADKEAKEKFAELISAQLLVEDAEKRKLTTIPIGGSCPVTENVNGEKTVEKIETKTVETSMGLLSDSEILKIKNLVSPMENKVIRKENLLSYGLEPYGYTFRLSEKYGFHNSTQGSTSIVNPKDNNATFTTCKSDEPFLIPPLASIIVSSIETFKIPKGITANICLKTTYIRSGLLATFGVVDSGYEGILSFCLFNTSTRLSVIAYPNEGLAQIKFFRPTSTNTENYDGNYQHSK